MTFTAELIFTTESGSRYEVDTARRRIRRLTGAGAPTPRQGKDGEWREYAVLSCRRGEPAVICWPDGTALLEGSPAHAVPTSITSRVVWILHDKDRLS